MSQTPETSAIIWAEQFRASQLAGHRAHRRHDRRLPLAGLRLLPAGWLGWILLAGAALVAAAVAK